MKKLLIAILLLLSFGIFNGEAMELRVLKQISEGQSGYSGYSGAIGADGASGYSGLSGINGLDSGYDLEIPFTNQTSVTIVHGFGAYPVVEVVDDLGHVFEPLDIYNQDLNTVVVSFDSSRSGTVVLTLGVARGESGYSGLSGLSGWSGYDAQAGYSGPSGYSGYSGMSGASGLSGMVGISGYSGISGASGYSGMSGVGETQKSRVRAYNAASAQTLSGVTLLRSN